MYCRRDYATVWNGERWVYGSRHCRFEVRYYFNPVNFAVHNAFTICITDKRVNDICVASTDEAPANVTKVSSVSGTVLSNEYDTVWAAVC